MRSAGWTGIRSIFGERIELSEVSSTGIEVVPNLPKCRGTAIEVVPNLPKCRVPVSSSYRTYRSAGYRYRVRTEFTEVSGTCIYRVCTEVTKVPGTGIEVVPDLLKCRAPV